MEQIEIIKRDGTVIKCFSPEPFCTPTQAVQETSLMSDDTVKITLRTTQPYQFGRGDKVVINGYTYKIRTTPERQLQTEEDYIHTLTFYGVMYDLMKCQYRNCDANGNSTKAIFDLTYSIKDFVRVAIYNLNRDNPGEWAFDEQNCPDTEPITVSFSKSNVLQVIQDLCSKDNFNLEFRITTANGVNTIHIGQFGEVVTPPSGADYFEYGKGNGLWQLKEKKVDDKAIITRLWAEGGTQNIKSEYRDYSDRLQLPYPQRVNRNRHVLKDGTVIEAGTQTIGVADDSKRYLEDVAMSQVIGVEEDTQTFDDVYPKRTGTVTALGGSVLEFVDNTMDFDLNEKDSKGNTRYLIDGTSAKLTFITGKLAGQEFELSKYDHTTKTFKLIAYTDERGLKIPTEDTDAFRFVVGDKYKLTDINMPDSYVQNAEEDLWYKALEYFNEAKQARCQYELTFDREYFLENMPGDSDTCLFKVGDYVPVKDTRFGIEKNIRIQKVSRNLLLDHSYTLTLSDTTAISVVAQSVLDVIEHEKIIQINDLRNLAKAKRGWRTTEELRNMVYDADGYFDPENIKPNSIDTNMLTVGSKSQQFVLTGVILEANYGGNVNKFSASSGVLSHLTIQEDSVRSWNMATQEVTLSQAGGYYVFAKCSKTGTNGVWYVTQDQLKVENDTDPNNYYFQVGVIGSLGVGDRFRDFTTTYGFTRINGNTITTGRIVTSDGESYLDLEGNEFRIGNSNSSLAWNVDGTGKLVLRGTMVQAGNGDLEKIGVWCGAFDPDRWYCLGDEVSYTVYGQTATFRYRYSTKTKGHLPTDTTYWEVTGSGVPGENGYSQAMVRLYKRAASKPSIDWSSTLTYTFATDTLSPIPSGWSRGVPANNGQALYITLASAVSRTATDTIAPNEFSGPVELVEDGLDGITKVTVYTNSTSKPTTPTGSSVPPAGWRLEKQAPASTLSVTSIAKASEEAYSHFDLAQVNDTYRIKCLDPDYLTNFKGYVQINFSTTSANEKIVISMRASCEGYYDNGFVTALDNTTEPSRSTASSYVKIVSGDGVCELATISVPTAGNHFVRVWYIKDASQNKYDDAIYFNVITFGGGKLWQSIGSVRGDTAIFWTEPTEYAQDSAITYQGEYQPNKMYYGNSARRDVVKFQAQYYLANLTAGSFVNVLPTNADFWTPFGTQWESVATDLLLANLANIGGLIFKDNCLISQKGTINGVESTDYTNPDFLPLLFLDGVNGQSVIQGSMRSPFGRFDESWRWDDEEALLSSDKLDNLYAPFGGYDLPFTWSYKNSGRRLTIVHNNNGVATDYSSNVLRAPVGQYFFEDGLSKQSLSFCNEILELLGYGVGNTFFGWIVLDRHDILTTMRYGHKIVSLAMGRVTGTSSYARFKYITVFDGTHGSNTSSVTTRDNKKFSIARLDEGKYRMIIPSGWVGSTTDLLVMATGEGYSYGGDSSPVKASVVIESTTSILINVSDDQSRNDGDFNFMIMNMKHWLAL